MHTIFQPLAFSKVMKKLLFCVGMVCGGPATHAQHGEVEADLRHVHVDALPGHARSAGDMLFPMALPFVDDFAWPSMAHEEGPVNLKRWEPSPVRRTTTLAFQPPTVGCATLDGLNASGDPYALTPVNPTGMPTR